LITEELASFIGASKDDAAKAIPNKNPNPLFKKWGLFLYLDLIPSPLGSRQTNKQPIRKNKNYYLKGEI
jgi:hypothetical protein